MIQKAERYINDVLKGEIQVSSKTRLTFERHVKDLENAPENGWYFDKKSVKRVFDFFSLTRHSPDKKSWVPFDPEPWQAAIIYILFGWKKKDGFRRFNYAYIELPKKNGKSTFASIISIYLLYFDGEQEAEVYHAATVEKQARICFEKAKKIIEKSPSLARRSRILINNVSIPETGSKMEPLGRDSESMEGINPHGGVIDEAHVFSWKNWIVYENMQSASVNRRQPLIIIITTSGRDKNLPCFEHRSLCIEILKGIKIQEDTFAIIYTLDEEDNWKDPETWKKANPNYGVSVIPERFQKEFEGALNSGTKEVSFKTKNLNLWVDAPKVWIKDEKYLACSRGIDPGSLLGQKCFAGLDLASHVDLNCLHLFFPDSIPVPSFLAFYWVPEEKVKEREDRVDYKLWVSQGHIFMTEGAIIDIKAETDQILEISKKYKIEGLAYDPYMAHHGVIQNLQTGGFPVNKLDPFSQGIRNMTAPTKEFEKIVNSGEAEFFNNPVTRWMLGNVQIARDNSDNIKPDRRSSADKIDGIVAAIMALGEYITARGKKQTTTTWRSV